MEIRTKKIASLVLISTIFFGVFMAMNTDAALGDTYPPLPYLRIDVVGDTADVYLTGEYGYLDPYWDIGAIDVVLRFDPSMLQGMYFFGDPDGSYASFFPNGIEQMHLPPEAWMMDNVVGYVRTALIGLPEEAPPPNHMPPEGEFRVLSVIFDRPIDSPLRLEKGGPRAIREPWGYEYFAIDIATIAEGQEGLPVPFIGGPPTAKIVAECISKANVPVAFDGSGYGVGLGYKWDFTGPTGTVSGQTASWTFTTPGVHKATLTVTDYLGNTAVASMKILCNKETLLQNTDVEHKVYDVSDDENAYNTLTVTAKNHGSVAGDVKAEFAFEDKRSGIPAELVLTAEGSVLADKELELKVNFKPSDFGYMPGTIAGYDSTVTLSFFCERLGEWIPVDTFKLTFKVVP